MNIYTIATLNDISIKDLQSGVNMLLPNQESNTNNNDNAQVLRKF